MAKGQKRSTREPRKPKQATSKHGKGKLAPTPRAFLESIDRSTAGATAAPAKHHPGQGHRQ